MDNKHNISFSHDKFFKLLLSDKQNAVELIQNTLPKKILKHIDLETLTKIDTQYVNKNLQISFADVLYTCKYKNSDLNIAFLFEHKSTIVEMPHLQMLGYMLANWQEQQKNNEQLTPIIPYVFYHGTQKWIKRDFFEYFNRADKILKKFIPEFEYLLFDTSEFANEDIVKLFRNMPMQIGVFLMKNIFDSQSMLENLELFAAGLQQPGPKQMHLNWLKSFILYLLSNIDVEPQIIIQKMETISHTAARTFKSAAEQLFEQGLQQGIQQGLQQGVREGLKQAALQLLAYGMPTEEVAKILNLPVEVVNEIKDQNRGTKA